MVLARTFVSSMASTRYLERKDGEGTKGFHGFGTIRDLRMEKADERDVHPSVQGVSDEHHLLPS